MQETIKKLLPIIQEAWIILMKYFQKNIKIEYKTDQYDQVTQADKEADIFLTTKIKKLFPNDQIASEESFSKLENTKWRVRYIDPLDSTKSFINNNDMFSIMIGLCIDGEIQLGIIYAPVRDELYYATKNNWAYLTHNQKTKKLQVSKIKYIKDSRHMNSSPFSPKRTLNIIIEENIDFKSIAPWWSIGLVIWEIAQGNIETYTLTNARACKRDICAPQIILEESGGILTDLKWNKPNYNETEIHLQKFYIATNQHIHNTILKKLNTILPNPKL